MVKVTPVELPFAPVLTVPGAFGVNRRLLPPLVTLNAGALTVTVWFEAPTTVYRAGVVAPEQLRSPATVPHVVMVPVVFIVTLSPEKVVPLSTMMPKFRFWSDERTS